jgi:chromosome segregation ATPase
VVSHAGAEGIYTCVDKQGRRLTADRPIIDCIDREQKEITPAGTVVRRIGPSLTADERAAADERARKEAEERSRLADEKRRDRALLTRYPDKAAHDSERAAALATVDDVIASANRRITELGKERGRLDAELEFYKGDLAKAPPKLKRQYEELDQQVAAQKRFIANQEAEKKRVNARYDDELVRLRQLWAQRMTPVAGESAKR